MKLRTFTLTLAMMIGVATMAQTVLYEEDFEGIQLMPPEITLIENDGYTPNSGDEAFADSAWIVGTSSRQELSGTQVAFALSYYTDMVAAADDWLILPSISIGSNAILTWEAMSTTSSGNYPDDYQVLIAPANGGAPTVQHFADNGAILFEIAPEQWSAFVSNPGAGLASRELNLNDEGWSDQDVWIAFRLITGDGGGSYLAIDNLKVVDNTVGIEELPANGLATSVYPNPANQQVSVAINSLIGGQAQIEFFDITGRVVLSENVQLAGGIQNVDVDIDGFNKGIYMVRTSIGERVSTSKLIVN